VKLGLGSVQEVALNLKALFSVTLVASQALISRLKDDAPKNITDIPRADILVKRMINRI